MGASGDERTRGPLLFGEGKRVRLVGSFQGLGLFSKELSVDQSVGRINE